MSSINDLPPELYHNHILPRLNVAQLCVLGCVDKARAALALVYIKSPEDDEGGTIRDYLRENLKRKVFAKHPAEGARINRAKAQFILKCREKQLSRNEAENLSRLLNETQYQENHFLMCPFIAVADLRTGHLTPQQLEHAITDAFRYIEVCGKDLDLLATLLFNHPHAPKIDVKENGGLGTLLRMGICRLCPDQWTDEERLRIVKMFFAHPNGNKIPTSELQTITEYIGQTPNSELTEAIQRHPNYKKSSSNNCTVQ